ncbi:hypothetical protein [Sulfitobacter pacificus]|uniref:Uncharacterized protein n=1 Tax=Sulfitobacter pacificus TaxID=1499314 RepID=A0ABQ5VFC2_9RHOB|nr:hypothetical protein [Sulfitobacter pacificus]GLQ25371.1 hypothetical protein GCM10007927_01740 [Sulfitobacter pacificus]
MRFRKHILLPLFAMLMTFFPLWGMAAEIDRFEGTFTGKAEFTLNGEVQKRDMSTTIKAQDDGFLLSWTSVTYRSDGRTKEATYTIQFVPSARENIFQSAMKKNLFGKATPLDPLQGEPFVWARFEGDMFSVFSLFINESGDYEVQEFHRTLVEGGLDLLFRRFRNGTLDREIETLLQRQE